MKMRISAARLNRSDGVKMLLAVVFVALIFLPLVRMFTYMDAQSIQNVVESPVFSQAVLHSLTAALLGTVITVVIALLLAFCVQRTSIHLKGLFGTILTLPMLIPSISIGMGLVFLLGNNGISFFE